MPEIPFQFVFLRQKMFGGESLQKLLANPNFSRLAADQTDIPESLIQGCQDWLIKLPAFFQSQQSFPQTINIDQTVLRVDPPEDSQEWCQPFQLTVHYVWWTLDNRYKIAFLPVFDVNAVAVGAGEIEHEVRREARNALVRLAATHRLHSLNKVASYRELELQTVKRQIDTPSPRQIAEKTEREQDKDKTLKSVARRLKPRFLNAAYLVENDVRKLSEKLGGKQPESVLLVGASGVGKTAIFHQLVLSAVELQMELVEFWQTDGSRLIAGMSGFGQWQQRCTELVKELEKKPAVIHLGNLVELIESGKGAGLKRGIADFLRPFMARGKITTVAECTAEQLKVVAQQAPQLLDVFYQLDVATPDARQTGEVLLEIATHDLSKRNKSIEPSGITAINQLHQRFARYSAMPGRAIRFFRNLIEDTETTQTISADLVTDRFSDETGLPKFLLKDSQRLDLPATKQWFEQRVIGQPEPIELITDLLAVVKSNLNREGRPIASLMFIGPTGVGKTQTAKALAEFMYRDEKKLVRFDMSEYKDPYSAERLIGGLGSNQQGLLTSKVRENPFTVVLLDEFEKAHSQVYDLFLQVLGEGRLTDGQGRLVDFSTCVIIMTSNLGSESFREVSLGFQSDTNNRQEEYRDHFVRKVQQQVRPEFFNRIDRVVPFSPLAPDAVEKIAQRELELIRKRYGIVNRSIDFKIHKSAPKYLAKIGYEPKYGARPLKRAIHQRLVQPLAKQLLAKGDETPLKINVHAQPSGLHFSVDTVEVGNTQISNEQEVRRALRFLADARRRAQALEQSPGTTKMRNVVYRQQRSLTRALAQYPTEKQDEKLYSNPELLRRKNEIDNKQQMIQRVESVLHELMEYEQQMAQQHLNDQTVDSSAINLFVKNMDSKIDRCLLEIFLEDSFSPSNVSLFAYSRHPDRIRSLIEIWKQVADSNQYRWQLMEIRKVEEKEDSNQTWPVQLPSKQDHPDWNGYQIQLHQEISEQPRKDLLGYAFSVHGPTAFHLLFPEAGLHRFKENNVQDVLVEATGENINTYRPSEGIQSLPKFALAVTKTYDWNSQHIKTNTRDEVKFESTEQLTEAAIKLIQNRFKNLLAERINPWN